MIDKRFYWVGALLLVAFGAFAGMSFKDALTPYVSYAQAMETARTVQVAGGLENGSSAYDRDAGALHFTLRHPDNDETLPVVYHGLKPANFEEAISIVAIGRWDGDQGVFTADELLVKCPSKYQGVEEKKYS